MKKVIMFMIFVIATTVAGFVFPEYKALILKAYTWALLGGLFGSIIIRTILHFTGIKEI